MLLRLLVGTGLFAFGYYLGKQVGMTEPIREELARTRDKDAAQPPREDHPNEPS